MAGNEVSLTFAIKAINEAKRVLQDVEKDLGDVGRAADTAGTKAGAAGTKMATFKTQLGGIGQVAGGIIASRAGQELIGFFEDAAKAAVEDEASTLRLQQAIRNIGGDYDRMLGQVEDAIDAGQRLGFTDDDIRNSFVTLAAATGDGDEAMRRLAVAQDLARGTGRPLTDAAKVLGKITEDNVQVLKRWGITLKETGSEHEALAEIQAKFAGQSKVFANSTAGRYLALQIKIAEFQEAIGRILLVEGAAILDEAGKAWDKYGFVAEAAFKVISALAVAGFNDLKQQFVLGFELLDGVMEIFAGVFTGDWQRVLDGVMAIVEAFWETAKNEV